jgi:hypothetical protein
VINGKEAHLLRAGSKGVFYSIRAPDEATAGAIFFEPGARSKNIAPSFDPLQEAHTDR